MNKSLFDKPSFSVEFNADFNAPVIKLWGFVEKEAIVKACESLKDILAELHCPILIYDLSEQKGPWDESFEWLSNQWIKILPNFEINTVFFLESKEVFSKICLKKFIEETQSQDIRIQYFNCKEAILESAQKINF